MALGVSLQDISRFLNISPPAPVTRTAPGVSDVAPFRDLAALRQLQRQLVDVFASVRELDHVVNGSTTLELSRPSARSSAGLGLNLVPTAALLQSSEQINATPTAFGPFGPAWSNGSSALLTIEGAYDGSNGTGVLSFEVRRAGVHGEDRLRIRVRDPANNVLTNVTLRPNHAIDRRYSLGNGLLLSLGEGSLVNRDTSAILVLDSVGSQAQSNRPFNGVRNNSPNLEYGLPAIVDGSFSLNGQGIAINASDTLDDVVARIDQSAAGVSASINFFHERIELTQNTAGSAATISLAGDTSNFLQNVKLDDATVVPGIDADPDRAIGDVASFAAALGGELRINGEAINVDIQSDSLNDVIGRINASGAGVSARFDVQEQRLVLESDREGSDLRLADNNTGLLAAFKLSEGTLRGDNADGPSARRYRNRVGDAVAEVADGLNAIFSDRGGATEDPLVRELRGQIESVVNRLLGEGGARDSGIGLTFRSTDAAAVSGTYATVDRRRLATLLRNGSSSLGRFFNGSREARGFIDELGAAVQQAVDTVAGTLGTKGSAFDSRA